jgi:hypothetical protein
VEILLLELLLVEELVELLDELLESSIWALTTVAMTANRIDKSIIFFIFIPSDRFLLGFLVFKGVLFVL